MTKGFTVLKDVEMPEFNGHGTLLKHDRTAMKIFYFMPKNNKENFFSFNFKTPVEDDSGIAHALQHLVLEGAKNFSVKNKISYLTESSFSSSVNATTENYKTSYYAESHIPEEYYRNLQVVGDSVFFPLLDENSFKQEVWRLDLDENKKPFLNGVVLNEMSSLSCISNHSFKKDVHKRIFQNSEKAFNYGGDFLEIPDLTCDKLVEFHKKYYTPANCLLFLFGKIDLEEQLCFLEDKLLCNLPGGTSETFIKDDIVPLPSMAEFKFDVPFKGVDDVAVTLNILCKEEEKDNCLERNFFFDRISKNIQRQLGECKIGEALVHSYIGSMKNKYFIVRLDCVKKDKIEKAKESILFSLEHCLDDGMDYDELRAACNKKDLEYENVKSTTDLDSLKYDVLKGWTEADNPFEFVSGQKKEWENLRDKMLSYNEEDFKRMFKNYLVENPNKCFFIETPDEDYFKKIEEKRTAVLERKIKTIE